MMKRFWRFNLHFVVLLLVGGLLGCATSAERTEKNQLTSLRVHLEGRRNIMQDGGKAVFRSGMELDILPDIITSDLDLESAEIVEAVGGFSLRLTFNAHGRFKLETLSTANRDKRLAIFMQWDIDKDQTENRWVAAPLLRGRITGGTLVFTPDATREEAERLVRGLNNAVKKHK